MCNLYSLNKNRESVAKMFKVGHNRAVDIPLLPGIFPNFVAPVVRQAADGEREQRSRIVALQREPIPRCRLHVTIGLAEG